MRRFGLSISFVLLPLSVVWLGARAVKSPPRGAR